MMLLVGSLLLLPEGQHLRPLLELCRWGPHQDCRGRLEVCRLEHLECLRPVFLDQIGLHLHHDVLALLQRAQCRQRALDGVAVVELPRPEAHLGLVVRGLGLGLRRPPALPALLRPVPDGPVADLDAPRILLEVHVQPVEAALVGQTDWEEHLTLLHGRVFRDLCVGLRGRPHHVALEGKRAHRLWAEVRVQRHALEGHGGEERLALQAVRKGLGLRDARPALEEADGVEVRAGFVEVEQAGHDVATVQLFRDLDVRRAAAEVALGVKTGTGLGRIQEQGGAGSREANLQQALGILPAWIGCRILRRR
mmetsp:Transcript_26333/g.70276  ORF Transcript_26333/g.70276 Transcript_26333/m.70276 type:complete len:308 (+) Transcript_26333:800-1723(+)